MSYLWITWIAKRVKYQESVVDTVTKVEQKRYATLAHVPEIFVVLF